MNSKLNPLTIADSSFDIYNTKDCEGCNELWKWTAGQYSWLHGNICQYADVFSLFNQICHLRWIRKRVPENFEDSFLLETT